jgi:CheY-like chemotaxis protein
MMNRARVMLIDDDDDIREIAMLVLEAAGYDVVTATDGIDALEKLDTADEPAVIVLDWMMPRMDGEQFLETLHAGPNASVPVIVLTGHAGTGRASDLGAAEIITKPPELSDLLDAVGRYATPAEHAPA